MGLTGKKKEMLFIIGQFFGETDKRFCETPLQVSVSKAEFIDIIKGMNAVSKTERSVYKNLEGLERDKYIVYDERNLSMTKKGFESYLSIIDELEHFRILSESVKADKIKFKRRIQSKLK